MGEKTSTTLRLKCSSVNLGEGRSSVHFINQNQEDTTNMPPNGGALNIDGLKVHAGMNFEPGKTYRIVIEQD